MTQDRIQSPSPQKDIQLLSQPGQPLLGKAVVPGDKSISHRSLMLAAVATGTSRITGLLEGEDVLATAAAMRQMGADINRDEDGCWTVKGVGPSGLRTPVDIIDMGNSGTSTRLIMGLIASQPITATITGDDSLRGRPMGRVIKPLEQLGAKITATQVGDQTGRLPLTIQGALMPVPLDYTSPVASAQVKSCVLLSGLNTRGTTRLRESIATRDHTERMLSAMGADIHSTTMDDGSLQVDLTGPAKLRAIDITVPGDISSAAFLLVAASIIPDSDLTLTGVGINPLRTGIIHALRQMGADITLMDKRDIGGEPVADIHVKYSPLHAVDGLTVDPSTMIDEFPVLFSAAATATGVSTFRGLKELRVKESDRLHVMATGLKACGVEIEELDDGLRITGNSGKVKGGGVIKSHLDHRIAMSFAILGQMAENPITIDDASPINTSFPGFKNLLNSMGANLS